jgi:hypothetical protein
MKITIELDDFDTRDFKHCEKRMHEDGYTDVTQTEVYRACRVGLETWFMENQHRNKPGPRKPKKAYLCMDCSQL